MNLDFDLTQYPGERDKEDLPIALPEKQSESYIKVVGVGGGGGNAVSHMYNEGIHDVTFTVCNTDRKALEGSPVPVKLQFGEGLGAGNNPKKGREAAENSLPAIKKMFEDGTKMTFITAGMGGGTGTGAAPVVARVAKSMDILTVGIVTIPFKWEGAAKIDQALDGVDELKKNVDAMLVINNQRLLELFPDKSMEEAFAISDDTLCNAAKSISEIITMQGKVGLDYEDVRTVLKDGGVAIMSTGEGQGENRVAMAIDNALHSPLLNNREVFKSKKILLNIVEPGKNGDKPLMMEEMAEIQTFMSKMQDDNIQTKWGFSCDPSLVDKVKITILASGFGIADINSEEMAERIKAKSEEELRQEQEKRARREKTYGSESKNGMAYVPINYYVFKESDLDNENLISNVASVPTHGRKKSQLEQFENTSNGVVATSEQA